MTGASALTAVFTVFSLIFSAEMKICKRIKAIVNHDNHITALAAVTAVRTAVCYKFFTPERYMTVAAFTASDKYSCSVYKLWHFKSPIDITEYILSDLYLSYHTFKKGSKQKLFGAPSDNS